jgi:hypothetical protein
MSGYVTHTLIAERPSTDVPFNLEDKRYSVTKTDYAPRFISNETIISEDGLTSTTVRKMTVDVYMGWVSDLDIQDNVSIAAMHKYWIDNRMRHTRIVEYTKEI